jgi:hypothetical protein
MMTSPRYILHTPDGPMFFYRYVGFTLPTEDDDSPRACCPSSEPKQSTPVRRSLLTELLARSKQFADGPPTSSFAPGCQPDCYTDDDEEDVRDNDCDACDYGDVDQYEASSVSSQGSARSQPIPIPTPSVNKSLL